VKRRKVLKEWYVSRATETILPRVKRHASELGVDFGEVKIVDNRYRWGSCTVKDNVNFNWRLIKAPMFVIDYVIVHELAHLMETTTPHDSGTSSAPRPLLRKRRKYGSKSTVRYWRRRCEAMEFIAFTLF
jgi:hypothetical protein